MRKLLIVALVLLVSGGLFVINNTSKTQNNDLQNLKAFAKLYGYVKYFHPSDEASKIDWDKFAVYGLSKIRNIASQEELKRELQKLFIPIAPTLQIYDEDESPHDYSKYLVEENGGLKTVAWQHYGVRLSNHSNIYRSIRTNRVDRNNVSGENHGFGTTTQGIDASPYFGKQIRLSAYVKTDVSGSGNQGQLWLRVDMPDNTSAFFDNMEDRPIKNNKWQEYEIISKVAEGAKTIVFGCFLNGSGKVYLDDLKLEYKDDRNSWRPIEINNAGFDRNDDSGKPLGWVCNSSGYSYTLVSEDSHNGNKCLKIESAPGDMKQIEKIFDSEPKPWEYVTKRVNDDLFCRFPLSVYSKEGHTIPAADTGDFYSIIDIIDTLEISSANIEIVNLADVITAWNVFQHFYPYFDVVDVDWENVLDESLSESIAITGKDTHYNILRKMVAKLEDGHGVVYDIRRTPVGGLPIRVEYIEDKLVITASEDSMFVAGDIITRVNGKDAIDYLENFEKYVSGSPQLKRYRTLNQFGYGEIGSNIDLAILRNEEEINLRYQRTEEMGNLFFNPISEFDFPDIQRLENNIYYVNLFTTDEKTFEDSIDVLLNARGVIFDSRRDGERKSRFKQINMKKLIAYLTDEIVETAKFNVPQIIYPDRENIEFKENRWPILPAWKKIKGKVVFINDPHVVSSGETYMAIVENYKLAEMVGEVTAGCNGNVNYIKLPKGYNIMWTGLQTLKHDGSQHHLVGIKPTYPIEKTIQAVKEGRDEYLEKSIEVIMNAE